MASFSHRPVKLHYTLAVMMACAALFAFRNDAEQHKIKPVTASSDHPVWRADLHLLGYPQNNPDLQRRRGFANFDTITFVSESVVAATFVTREDIPDPQRREDPNHISPYRLHAIFLDALSGKVLHSLDWPVERPNAGIFPRHDGGFLLLATDRIVSYSADWTKIDELPLTQLLPADGSLGGIAESPTARSLVLQFLLDSTAICFNVHTDTLESSETPCSTLDTFTAADDGIIAPEKLPDGAALREFRPGGASIEYGVAVPKSPAEPRGQSRDSSIVVAQCDPCVAMPQFINNEMIAVYTPSNIRVMERGGKIRFIQTFDVATKWLDEFGRPVRASANGQRFAVASNALHLRGVKDESFAIHVSTGDIPAEFPLDVQVYDLPAAQWIYTLQINADHLKQIWGLALSPDGEKLAIDSGGTIQFFSLPATNAAPK
jgi:hypothetical protein